MPHAMDTRSLIRNVNERWFQTTFEHAAIGMAVNKLNGRFIEANPTFCRITGFSRDELLAMDFRAITHREDRPRNLEEVRRLMAGEIPSFVIEKRYVRKDGNIVWVKNSITLLRDNQDKPLYIVALAEDANERKLAEEAYLASESRFRAILEKSFDCINLIDACGTILYTSPSSAVVLGYPPEEYIGRNAFDFLHPEDVPQCSEKFKRLLCNPGSSEIAICRGRHKDGSWRWLEARGTSLLHEPSIEALIVNFHDITEQKLAQEQLRQAQKMEAIGRLAGGIAHDFNNLLHVINGYSDLLLQQVGPDDPMREMLAEIRKAGELSASLTHQLLAFSRRQVLTPKPLNLNEVIGNIEKMLHRILGENVKLAVNLAPDLDILAADPSQIQQILLNLAVNARDAMPSGGTLTIQTSNREVGRDDAPAIPGIPPGRYVVLSVQDTGCGMTAEIQSHIFEPFFTTKEPGNGTGLGLSTIYGIVKQSGGHIEVKSEPGCGTEFLIYLPRVEEQASPFAGAAERQRFDAALKRVAYYASEAEA